MRRFLIFLALAASAALPARAATASISGTVTDGNGRAVPNVCVSFVTGGLSTQIGAQNDGTYSFDADPGVYTVLFSDCINKRYAHQWWPGQTYLTSAGSVYASPGAHVAGIDAQLVPGGTIIGRVTDEYGAPLAGECVDATGPNGTGHATTDATGWYGAVEPEGDYLVRFSDCAGHGYATQWYDGSATAGKASTIQVIPARLNGLANAVMTDEHPDVGIYSIIVSQDLATGVGMYNVTVFVKNWRAVDADATLLVEVCPATLGSCEKIAEQDEPLPGSVRVGHDFAWNSAGWIGRATLTARVVLEDDANPANNEQSQAMCVMPFGACVADVGVRAG
jgi:hypothetical protein